MDKLFVIKIGGSSIDEEEKLSSFLQKFALLKSKKVLVHGGGKLASKLALQLNIPQQVIDGRRMTDAGTLKIVTMVYAGYINKNIVAKLQAHGCNAIGLSGADGNLLKAHKRISDTGIDYGFAGDIDAVNTPFLKDVLSQEMSPVIAPITHDMQGQLLNTNADTVAQEIAKALSAVFDVSLVYCFEKSGVLLDAEDAYSVIEKINASYYTELKQKKLVFAGMIPKLDNAFSALNNGVKKVLIGKAEDIDQILKEEAGTRIVNE